jgi:SRSO17 transposase
MDARKLAQLRNDLTAFLDEVAGSLGHPRRRHWCDAYLRGVLLDGHRKSVEPMAARLRAIEPGDEGYGQSLQQFLNQSPWDEQPVLDDLHARIGRRFGTDGFLIIDDTGFPEQGEHSVGVARRYTGTLGKVARCQVAVTLQFATAARVVALDARLYLPEAGAGDRERLTRAGAPAAVGYEPKWQLARAMVRRAVANGFRGVVLADSLFGTVTAFREGRAAGGRAYGVGIDSTLEVIAADADLGPVPRRRAAAARRPDRRACGRGRPPRA